MTTTHIVAEADDGIRLDRWFKRYQPHIPHALLEKSLRKGQVRLDGKKAKAAQRVAAGQVIEVRFEVSGSRFQERLKPQTSNLKPEDAQFIQRLVLYKDDNVIVINKPAGLAVQGGSGIDRHLDGMLDGLRFEAAERPKLVHRLDKDTSGCLALARSAKAAAILANAFANRKAEKIYQALVIGLPMPLKGTIDLPLAKLERGKDSRMDTNVDERKRGLAPLRRAGCVPPSAEGAERNYETVQVDKKSGLRALTEYRVIEHCSNKISWVELHPITGRTHQLRVHMAAIGHPIMGDGKYGGAEAFVQGSIGLSDKLHLHAARLVIPDIFGKTIDVKAPVPEHIKKSLKALEIDT